MEKAVQTAHSEELSGVREDNPPVLEEQRRTECLQHPLKAKTNGKTANPEASVLQGTQKLDVKEWKRVLFSNESLFQLFTHPNREIELVWAENQGCNFFIFIGAALGSLTQAETARLTYGTV